MMLKDTIEEVSGNLEDNFTIDGIKDRIESNKKFNDEYEQKQNRILIFGVGGGGSNSVERMYKNNLQGVEFLIANTDFKDLQNKTVPYILIGKNTTAGNGAGRDPEIGRKAAEESIEEIREKLTGVSLVFLVTYLGGGTGTGATPVIARLAKEMGILVIAMVTKPPRVEGEVIMRYAIDGINELKKDTGTLIVIPMDNLDRVVNSDTKMIEAHEKIIDFISMSIKSITDLITTTSEKGYYIGLDLADVKTNMKNIGKTMMGFGEAEGENRAIEAVEEAIHNPLLDNVSIRGTKSIIVNITTSEDTGYLEVISCREKILEEVDNPDALIITGHILDSSMGNKLRVSIFATGIGADDENKVVNNDDEKKWHIDLLAGNNNDSQNVKLMNYGNDNNIFNKKSIEYNGYDSNNIGNYGDQNLFDNRRSNRTRTGDYINETLEQKINNPMKQRPKIDKNLGFFDDEAPVRGGKVSIEDQYKDEMLRWRDNEKNNLYGNRGGYSAGNTIYSPEQMDRQKEEAQKRLDSLKEQDKKKKKKSGFFATIFGGGKKDEDVEDDDDFQFNTVDNYENFNTNIE